jgi:hypothetical protein
MNSIPIGSHDRHVIKHTWLLDVEPTWSFQTTLQDETLQTAIMFTQKPNLSLFPAPPPSLPHTLHLPGCIGAEHMAKCASFAVRGRGWIVM